MNIIPTHCGIGGNNAKIMAQDGSSLRSQKASLVITKTKRFLEGLCCLDIAETKFEHTPPLNFNQKPDM